MFGLFTSNEFKELMSLYERAVTHYDKDFGVVIDASDQALSLLPQIKSWPRTSNADRYLVHADLLMLRANAKSAIYGLSQCEINNQITIDLEKALDILEPKGRNYSWAKCCFDLSLVYAKSPNGSRIENIERAIHFATVAKEYYKESNDKGGYASCCGNLADFYVWRLKEEKKDNIEKALVHTREASLIYTEKSHLFLWAKLKFQEAEILMQYYVPDRSERIEAAINQVQKLLGVFSRQNNPREWILSRKVLSELYVHREAGSKTDNIEYAIEILGNPLSGGSLNEDRELSRIQYTTLSSLYGVRTKDGRKENLSLALKFAYEAERYCVQTGHIGQLYPIKSQIARHTLALHQFDPFKNPKEVEKKINEAIEIPKSLGDDVSMAHELGKLAEYYITVPDLNSKSFEKSLDIYIQIEDIFREIDPIHYHIALMNKASILPRIEEKYIENTTEAIECFQTAHDYFDKNGIEEKLIYCKVNMAMTLISMQENGIPDQTQRAIALLEQVLDSKFIQSNNNPQQKAQAILSLSKAYRNRTTGDLQFNKKIHIESLLNSLQLIDPDQGVYLWIDALVEAVELVFDIGDDGKILRELQEFMENKVFAKVDSLKFPVPWARARRAYAKILKKNLVGRAEQFTKIIKVNKEAVEALERYKKGKKFDWADAKFDLARTYAWCHSQDSSVDFDLCIQAYNDGLSVVTPESWSIRYFRVQLEIGKLYVKKEEWLLADESFKKAIYCAENYLDDGKNAPIAELLDRNSGWLLTLIPFVALINGDIRRALTYSEKFKARSLKTALDVEEYLSQQVNEQSLRVKYKGIKIGERAIETQVDGNTQDTIDKLDSLKSDLERSNQGDLLSSAHREFDLDECLASLENWVLIPFVGYEHTILVLLSPGGVLKDAKISEVLPHGNKALSTLLAGDSNGNTGCFLALQNFSYWYDKREKARKTKTSTIEQQKIARELFLASDTYETKQSEVDKFLWDNYGQWIINVTGAKDADNPEHITIVPQAPLHAFSFGSAAEEQGKLLLDYCEISYSPSLYAKVSLDRRAKNYSQNPALTFLSANPEELKSSQLEGALSSFYFQHSNIVNINGQRKIENVIDKLCLSNYWHFGVHGKFLMGNPNNSYLELAGGMGREEGKYELRLNILAALKTETPLRMVSLTACEVGMQSFTKTPNEPLGFPTGFLQIGAIGVIAPLWQVSDDVSALIMNRFYDYHITQSYKPAAALRLAQCWLKGESTQSIIDYLTKKIMEGIINESDTDQIMANLKLEDPADRPFSHPIFWAAFNFYGA